MSSELDDIFDDNLEFSDNDLELLKKSKTQKDVEEENEDASGQ